MKPVSALGNDPFAVIADDCDFIIEQLGAHAERLAGKNVLITGAAGMLPAYLVDTIARLNEGRRLSKPAQLTLVVRSEDANENRLGHLHGRRDVTFIVADASTTYRVASPQHLLIHAASPAAPPAYRADPAGTRAVNVEGTRYALDLARQFGAESVLYFSTSEVYGNPPADKIPTPESYVDANWNRESPYTAGKVQGEALCIEAFREWHAPVKIVRPFHFHGPGLKLTDGRIVAELIRLGLSGEPIALKSDGKATRTYGYAADAAIAFLRILLSDANGEAFNVGAPGPETSMRELATVTARLLGITDPVRVSDQPSPPGSPMRVRPDVSKLKARLGVEARVSLEDGLARTIHWHRTRTARAAS